MTSKSILGGLALIIIIAAAYVTLVHNPPQPSVSTTSSITTTIISAPAITTLKGLSFSPRGFAQSDISGFFANARGAASVITWAGDWGELENLSSSPAAVTSLSQSHNYTSAVIAQFFVQSTGALLRPFNATTNASYVQGAAQFAAKYKPAYMGLGIEVNLLYQSSPGKFAQFVSLYTKTYDAIKAASPSTKVFTVFQLEKMKGLNGGLYGNTLNANGTEWGLIEDFPKSDLVGFTTYPGLIYNDTSQIPTNYYSEIAAHTSKPIAFVEIGWQSSSISPLWQNDEKIQSGFIHRFFNLTSSLNKSLEVWSFLYDPTTAAPFNSMGLYYDNGTQKASFDSWVSGR